MRKITIPLLFLLSWTFVLAQKTIDAGPDKTVSLCPPSCDTLKATVISKKGTDDYKLDTIPYAPMKFDTGTVVVAPYNAVSKPRAIGFTFCFWGNPYDSVYIGSNGWLGFSPGQSPTFGCATCMSTGVSIPNDTAAPKNAIMLRWSQLGLWSVVPIFYGTYGTAPFRKFVVSYYKPGGLAPGCFNAHDMTQAQGWQIVLYETTNVIEFFIKEAPQCGATDSISYPAPFGVQGLHNITGKKAIPVPGRNNTRWTAYYDGRRFTPNAGNVSYKINWYQTDTTKLIAADTAKVKVCPTAQTSYIARVIYQTCPVDTFYDTVAVKVSGGGFPAKATVKSPPTCGQANGSILITVTGGTANYIYEVKDSTNKKTVSGPSAPSAATTYTASNLAAGKYYTTATDSKGCVGLDSIVLTSSNGPTPFITGGPLTFCQGGNVVLDAGSSYKSYKWAPGNQTTQTITVTTSGIYNVTVTDANGCSGTSSSKTVTVNPLPTPTITTTRPTTFCQGDSTVLDAGTYSSYLWSTKEITQKITVKTSGSDSVTVTDANGCKGTTSIKIIVNPNPVPVITPNGPTTFCQGDSVLLTATTSATYLWTPAFGNVKSIIVKTTGSFTVQITDVNGCKGTSLPLTVTIAPNLNMTITGITEICQGDSTTLTAAGAVRYVWNTGNSKDTLNQLTIKPSVNTTYIVSGTNQSGSCKGADTVTVTVNSLPTANVGADLKMCEGEKVVLNSSGNASYSYSWTPTTPPTLNDSNSVSPVASPQTTTTYIAKITDNKNCVAFDTVTVTVNPLPAVDAGTDVTITSGESAVLKAVSSSQGTLIWSPATGLSCTDCQSTSANPQQTTRYHVSLTDSNGCKASDSVVVYKTCGDLYIPNAFTPNHDDKNEVFTVEQTGFTKINMYIFDRWGEQVYETDSFDKPWNGKVGDVEAQQDVYVYVVYAWDCSEQKHKYIGHVTLIR